MRLISLKRAALPPLFGVVVLEVVVLVVVVVFVVVVVILGNGAPATDVSHSHVLRWGVDAAQRQPNFYTASGLVMGLILGAAASST